MYTLDKLLELKLVPSDTKLVGYNKKIYTTLEEFKATKKQAKLARIIIPNAQWIATCSNGQLVYSMDENGKVGRYNVKRLTYVEQIIEDDNNWKNVRFDNLKSKKDMDLSKVSLDTARLPDINKIVSNNKESMEEYKMEQNKDVSIEDLNINMGDDQGIGEDININIDTDNIGGDDLLAGINASEFKVTDNAEDPVKMDSFSGAGKVEDTAVNNTAVDTKMGKAKQNQARFKADVTADIEGIQSADVSELIEFNYKKSLLIGYITNKSEYIAASAPEKLILGADGLPLLKPSRTTDVEEQYNRNKKSVSKVHCLTEREIVWKEIAPGKIIGAVIAMPKGGVKPLDELMAADTVVTPDYTQLTLSYQLVNKDELGKIMNLWLPARIKESTETFGEFAGDLEVKLAPATGKNTGGENGFRYRFKSSNKHQMIGKHAYFPLKSLDYITIDKNLTQGEADDASASVFHSFYNQTKSKTTGKTDRKIDGLAPIYKEAIKREIIQGEDAPHISSKFFTTDINGRMDIVVKPFWAPKTSNEQVSVIKIARKMAKPTKTGSISYRYVTYDVLNKKYLESADYANKTAFHQAKYETFLNACHGAVTREDLKTLVASTTKSTRRKGADTSLTIEQQRRVIQGQIEGKTSMVLKETGIVGKDALKSFVNSVKATADTPVAQQA